VGELYSEWVFIASYVLKQDLNTIKKRYMGLKKLILIANS